MTYEEFEQQVEKIYENILEDGIYPFPSKILENHRDAVEKIQVSWITGGVGGGNCWEPGGHYDITPEVEPEFVFLDKLLEEVCPDISFLKYKNLCTAVLRTETREFNEYYGNRTRYGYKSVNIRELFEYLENKGLI